MEKWLSGRRRTIGNRVYVDSVSRVRIPSSPPIETAEFAMNSAVSSAFMLLFASKCLMGESDDFLFPLLVQYLPDVSLHTFCALTFHLIRDMTIDV